MAHRYTDTEIDFIRENIKGKNTYELTEMFNEHFCTDLTRNQIRSCMKNHKITSGIDRKNLNKFRKKVYTENQEQFIKDNVKGKSTKELTTMFNEHFGLDFNLSQIRSFLTNHKLKNGLDCRFKAGQSPYNKGKKGIIYEGCKKTWFKKGNKPVNHRSVGSERINVEGYTEIKVAEPSEWKLKHRVIWEEHNGPLLKGDVVIFGDGDRQNLDINNLILITNQQLLTLNWHKLIQNDADLTRTAVIIADLYQKISKRKGKAR